MKQLICFLLTLGVVFSADVSANMKKCATPPTQYIHHIKAPSRRSNGNKRALRATQRIMAFDQPLHISKKQILKISRYIENEAQARIQNKEFYLRRTSTGLSRTIEYDPAIATFFIHLKRKNHLPALGAGKSKIATLSILYSSEKPKLVATVIFRNPTDEIVAKELQTLQALSGAKNIVGLISHTTHPGKGTGRIQQQFIFDLYNRGSLQKLRRNPIVSKRLSESVRYQVMIAKDLLKGVRNLHVRNLCHNDIHAGNCLINETKMTNGRSRYSAALTDFEKLDVIDQNTQFSKIRDLYMLGCTLYEVFHNLQHYSIPQWKVPFPTNFPKSQENPDSFVLGETETTPRLRELEKKGIDHSITQREKYEKLILQLMNPTANKTADHYINEISALSS